MKKLALTTLFLLLASSCATSVYHDRYGTEVAVSPEFWGTVTYVDPGAHYINLDYYDGTVRQSRVVYYSRGTRWDGIRDSELRTGDKVWVRGRENRGRWNAENMRRHE